MTTTEQTKTYRIYWNYATKAGTVDKRRAAQISTVEAESAEAAAALASRSYRIIGEVREA